MRLIRRVNLEDFYVPVGVVLPILNCKLSTNVNVNRAAGIVGLSVIRMLARLAPNRDETVSQEHPLSTWKRLKKLNDIIVNEQPIVHGLLRGPVFNRRSNSSSVANFSAGLSIFSDIFLRYAASLESSSATRKACTRLRS